MNKYFVLLPIGLIILIIGTLGTVTLLSNELSILWLSPFIPFSIGTIMLCIWAKEEQRITENEKL